nr:putative nucleotidyltransferase, ribonuclease H [Tanacetum cinerariifolium]
MLVAEISNDLLRRIQYSWLVDPSVQQVIKKVKENGSTDSKFSWQNDQLRRNYKNRFDRNFAVGDWVLLKLQSHRKVTLRMEKHHKFSPKFYGPFQVLAKYGEVAYKLSLQVKGQPITPIPLPHCNKEGLITAVPVAVLDRKIAKVNNAAVVYWLIQWSNGNADDATWEVANDLQARYPEFDADS